MAHTATVTGLRPLLLRHGVQCLILYGSIARGEDIPGADMDLAVLFRGHPTSRQEEKLFHTLTTVFPDDTLDVSVLNSATPLLAYHVSRDGLPLFEARRGDFLRFQIQANRRHWDTRRFRALRESFALS